MNGRGDRRATPGPLRALVEALRATEAGRRFGLHGVRSTEDLRHSVPLMDPARHLEEVEGLLGFATTDDSGHEVRDDPEREGLVSRWRTLFERADPRRETPSRIGILRPPADDPRVDATCMADFAALGVERVERIESPSMPRPGGLDQVLAALRAWDGDTLVMPSLSTCAWLEGHLRAPLERGVRNLRWLFVEHDFDRRVRSRLPILNAGWLHPAGRIGLPGLRRPESSFCLATQSCHIELLPEPDPQADPRRRETAPTVVPARAVMGERYEIVVSSARGFLRLRTGEHVRVVGFAEPGTAEPAGDGSPRPRVARLHPPPPDVALEGVTLAGAWLTASVRQAFRPEDPALVAAEIGPDPGAVEHGGREEYSRSMLDPFADTELGGSRHRARRASRRPRALFVRVELQGESDPTIQVRLSERIDDALRTRSPAYAYLRQRGELWEPRVMVAKSGTARRGREARLFARFGRVEVPGVRVLASE